MQRTLGLCCSRRLSGDFGTQIETFELWPSPCDTAHTGVGVILFAKCMNGEVKIALFEG